MYGGSRMYNNAWEPDSRCFRFKTGGVLDPHTGLGITFWWAILGLNQ